MAVIRCPQGHYYDDEKFSHCPHCGIFGAQGTEAGAGGGRRQTDGERPAAGRRKGLFGWLDREQTIAFPSGKAGKEEGRKASSEAVFSGGEGYGEKMDGDSSLAFQSSKDDGEGRTIGIYSGQKGNDYVTGWLVCVKGPEKGRDYRLHHGFNRLGRGLAMDVQIMEDGAISRDCHCSVVYDGKGNQFSLLPGNGTLTYRKGRLVTEPERLEDGDEITAGESSFVLVFFCREGRVWDEDEERKF